MIKNLSKNWKNILLYVVLLAIIFGSVFYLSSKQTTKETEYSQIVTYFRQNDVTKFELDLSSGSLKYYLREKPKEEKTYSVPSPALFLDDVSDYVKDYNEKNPKTPITYNYLKGSSGSIWVSILPTLLLVLVIGGFGLYMVKKMSGAISSDTNKTLGFGKARTKILVDDEKRKTTFADVAGCDEEKQELSELVEFLREPEKFNKLGARIPKGVLLVGPPGTGKTLLARAVAGEAGAPFLSISGSDFVEMYVGVGASRVRDLFAQAKKQSPAIIFIDEIDAVGRHRGAGMGGGNDEREQTLNQLLVEMDGFGANEGVIIIAATNRPDVLDPALLRPGRFDRQVTVGLPDTKGREEILKVHSKNKPLGPDVNLKDIAKSTIGFSGADLENVLNEAALFAARNNRKAIINQDIQNATLKVVMGSEKKSHKFTEKAKRLTAVHEAGHAIASYFTPDTDPVKEISIIPRSKGAGGYTMYIPQDEDFNYNSKASMLGELVSLVGGRVAEAVVLKDISTGASNDLQRASSIARDMVTKYGMSEKLGPVAFNDDNDEVFLGMDYGHVKSFSEKTSAIIDSEVSRIVNEAYDKCLKIITENVDALNKVAEILMDKEKISGDDFKSIVEKGYIEEPELQPEEEITDDNASKNENSATDDEYISVDDKTILDDENLEDNN